jgi:hypothetical protein
MPDGTIKDEIFFGNGTCYLISRKGRREAPKSNVNIDFKKILKYIGIFIALAVVTFGIVKFVMSGDQEIEIDTPIVKAQTYLEEGDTISALKELTLASTEEYADFEYFLRPTFDFKQELLSQGDEIEVLEPKSFRGEMKDILQRMLKRYS